MAEQLWCRAAGGGHVKCDPREGNVNPRSTQTALSLCAGHNEDCVCHPPPPPWSVSFHFFQQVGWQEAPPSIQIVSWNLSFCVMSVFLYSIDEHQWINWVNVKIGMFAMQWLAGTGVQHHNNIATTCYPSVMQSSSRPTSDKYVTSRPCNCKCLLWANWCNFKNGRVWR